METFLSHKLLQGVAQNQAERCQYSDKTVEGVVTKPLTHFYPEFQNGDNPERQSARKSKNKIARLASMTSNL